MGAGSDEEEGGEGQESLGLQQLFAIKQKPNIFWASPVGRTDKEKLD